MKVRSLSFLLLVLAAAPLRGGVIVENIEKCQAACALPVLTSVSGWTVIASYEPDALRRFLLVSSAAPKSIDIVLGANVIDPGEPTMPQIRSNESYRKRDNAEGYPEFTRLRRWPSVSGGMSLEQLFSRAAKIAAEQQTAGKPISGGVLFTDGIALWADPPLPLEGMASVVLLRYDGTDWRTIKVEYMPRELLPGLNLSAPAFRAHWTAEPPNATPLTALDPVSGRHVKDGKILPDGVPVLTAEEARRAVDKARQIAPIDQLQDDTPDNNARLAAALALEVYSPDAAGAPNFIKPALLALGLRQPPFVYRNFILSP